MSHPEILVGRQADLEGLERDFAQGARAVTLTGPPGVGKSRLAQAFAGPDALVLDLSSVRTRDSFLAEVAVTVGVQAQLSDLEGPLGEALRDRQAALIVLDNCEHLVTGITQTLTQWLELAPELRVLISSRRPFEFPVGRTRNVFRLDEDAAIQLFIDEARSVGVELDELPALSELVKRLDCMPLAVRIVARHTDVLSVKQLSEQLEDVLGLAAPADARHATMHEAIAWSWKILQPWEQAALAQCGVFETSFSLDALKQVLQLEPLPDAPADHIGVLRALHHHSLLSVEHDSDGNRYRLPRAVKSFVRDKHRTHPGDHGALARHDAYYAKLAIGFYEAYRSPAGHTVVDAIQREASNLAVVMERGQKSGRSVEHAVVCWLALAAFLHVSRHPMRSEIIDKGRELLEADPTVEAGVRREAILLSTLLDTRRNPAAAVESIEALIEEAEREELTAIEGRARRRYGEVLKTLGRGDEAEIQVDKALRCLQAVEGEDVELTKTQCDQALMLRAAGELAQARRVLLSALARCQRVGSPYEEIRVRTSLGLHGLDDGDFGEAEEQFRGAARLAEEVHNDLFHHFAKSSIAFIEHSRGELESAIPDYERGARALRRLGDPLWAQFEAYRAVALWERGDINDAERALIAATTTFADKKFVTLERLWSTCLAVLQRNCDLSPEAPIWETAADAQQGEAFTVLRWLANLDEPTIRSEAVHWYSSKTPLISFEAMLLGRVLTRQLQTRRTLVWEPGEMAFEVPGVCERSALRTHATLFRVLAVLVDELRDHPGRPVDVEQLLKRAWPDERLKPRTARNRVYVAVAKLRKLGLETLLVKDDRGYFLDSSLELDVR